MNLSSHKSTGGGGYTNLYDFLKSRSSRFSHGSKSTNLYFTTLFTIVSVFFLALTLAPTIDSTNSVSATSSSSGLNIGINEVLSLSIESYDEITASYVNNPNLSMSIIPGTFKTASARITADTNAPYGYHLVLSNNDSNNALVEQNDNPTTPTNPVISSITTDTTIADTTDSTKLFPDNTWGYNLTNTSSTPPTIPLTYSKIPTSTTSSTIANTTNLGSSTYTFTAGTRVDKVLPAGIYKDELIFSIIANAAPLAPSFYTTYYMQNFNQTACNSVKTPTSDIKEVTDKYGSNYHDNGTNATIVPSTTLIDKRDGQSYTIRKLADGNCWMTENLRFGATTNTAADTPNPWSSTTDPATNTATTSAGASVLADSTNGLINTHIITKRTGATGADGSTAFGDTAEYYTKPYIAIYQANTTDTVSGTGTKFGALYNYCAATGGTACTASGDTPTVSGSICPTNWKLPAFDSEVGTAYDTNASYNNLTATYNIGFNTAAGVTAIVASPLSFPRAGYFGDGSLSTRNASGDGGYWSSTPGGGTYAYLLLFYGTENISRLNGARRYGRSVRCVIEG